MFQQMGKSLICARRGIIWLAFERLAQIMDAISSYIDFVSGGATSMNFLRVTFAPN
jgi:hypothetical protein